MLKRFTILTIAVTTLAGCVDNGSLSGDVYTTSDAKKVQALNFGTVTHVRPIKIKSDDSTSTIGALGGAIIGGFLGNTVGGGTGRSLATAGGAIIGGLAGQGTEAALNTSNGVELEIRKDSGESIVVVQKQSVSQFKVGQRVAIAGRGQSVTVSPR